MEFLSPSIPVKVDIVYSARCRFCKVQSSCITVCYVWNLGYVMFVLVIKDLNPDISYSIQM